MSLDNTHLIRCSECGRLMSKTTGVTLCSRCMEKQQKTVPLQREELTQYKIILTPPDENEAITNDEKENSTEEKKVKRRICSMCGKYPTLPNRDLCLSCTLDMYKGFQSAAKELSSEKKSIPPKKIQWAYDAYTSTRRMEPSRHIHTQGLTWIKGYNLH
ncbi:MAG: hypothetical protein ACP5UA_07690 [Candidatus Hydrogenedens sp.]